MLPRVKGITFALVTLGMASVFRYRDQSRDWPRSPAPTLACRASLARLSQPLSQRLRFYFIALVFTVLVYLIYRRFVDSPTGRVCIATRENEERAKMLGYQHLLL